MLRPQSLEGLLADGRAPLRLRRKALNLVADLLQLDAASGATHAGLDHSAAAAAMLALLAPAEGGAGGSGPSGSGAGSGSQGVEDLDMQVWLAFFRAPCPSPCLRSSLWESCTVSRPGQAW